MTELSKKNVFEFETSPDSRIVAAESQVCTETAFGTRRGDLLAGMGTVSSPESSRLTSFAGVIKNGPVTFDRSDFLKTVRLCVKTKCFSCNMNLHGLSAVSLHVLTKHDKWKRMSDVLG